MNRHDFLNGWGVFFLTTVNEDSHVAKPFGAVMKMNENYISPLEIRKMCIFK